MEYDERRTKYGPHTSTHHLLSAGMLGSSLISVLSPFSLHGSSPSDRSGFSAIPEHAYPALYYTILSLCSHLSVSMTSNYKEQWALPSMSIAAPNIVHRSSVTVDIIRYGATTAASQVSLHKEFSARQSQYVMHSPIPYFYYGIHKKDNSPPPNTPSAQATRTGPYFSSPRQSQYQPKPIRET
jgi:hypothetical protein